MRTMALLLVLSACGSGGDAGSAPDDTIWVLTAGTVDGDPLTLIPGYPVTFGIRDGQAGGIAACNQYGGAIDVQGGRISFPDGIAQTEMACLDDGVMDLEARYLNALLRATGMAATEDELRITGPDIELRFEVAPPEPDAALVGTTWTLDTVIEGGTASTPVAPATLHIDDQGRVTGTPGCNTMSGTYSAAEGFSTLATTKMGCEPTIMDQEQFVLAILEGDPTLTIEGRFLTIADDNGNAVRFQAEA